MKITTQVIVASVMLFALLAGVTYCKVNQYDLGEFVMNTIQTVTIAAAAVLVNWFKSSQ